MGRGRGVAAEELAFSRVSFGKQWVNLTRLSQDLSKADKGSPII